jgi:2-iminobutanoate/2-iminopropanoate deaminase
MDIRYAGALLVSALGTAMTAGAEEAGAFAPQLAKGRFVYVSGTRPSDDSGRIAAGDIKAQTRRTLENLGARLKAGGSSLANAASVNVYLKNASDFAAMNEVYRGFWPKDPPVRTTVVARGGELEALVEMTAVGIAQGAERKIVHPKDWAPSANPYSYGVLSGDTLFLAGLVSRSGKDNQVITGDITTQTRAVLENAGEILRAAGMSHADAVSSRVYITDTALFQDMNAVYRPFFPQQPPARATVRAALMNPQYVVEITLVAVKDESRQVFTTPNADGSPGRANPNLSSAIRVGDRVFASGMLGNTEATRDDVAAQTRETLARLERTLVAAGSSFADVVDAVVYVTDLKFKDAVLRACREKLGGRSTGVLVEAGLVAPDGLVEIMLVAAKR